jgi:hypothetical protein
MECLASGCHLYLLAHTAYLKPVAEAMNLLLTLEKVSKGGWVSFCPVTLGGIQACRATHRLWEAEFLVQYL